MARVNVEISPGEIIRVFGPAKIHVLRGRVMVLGAVFSEGESFEVSRYRSYGIKALEEPAAISIVLGEKASLEQPGLGEEVLDKWVEVGDRIVSTASKGSSVVVIGPTDAGKSSFAALLVNRALHAGKKVAVIDADIGQADVGPPGFVSAAFVQERILWLRALRAEQLRFVGSITPSRFEKRILSSIIDLYDWAVREGADLVVVDTDGWVYGLNALEYKLELIRLLRPHAVIVVGDKMIADVAANVLRGSSVAVYYVESPAVVKVRDREDRRALRSEAYRKFFEGAELREVDLNSVAVFGSCLLMGRPLEQEKLEYMARQLGVKVIAGSEGSDYIMLVVDKQPRASALERMGVEKQVYVSEVGSERGLYVALLDGNLVERAPGIVQEIDYQSYKAKIYTSYKGEIGGVIFGAVKLSFNGEIEEVGRAQRCTI